MSMLFLVCFGNIYSLSLVSLLIFRLRRYVYWHIILSKNGGHLTLLFYKQQSRDKALEIAFISQDFHSAKLLHSCILTEYIQRKQ